MERKKIKQQEAQQKASQNNSSDNTTEQVPRQDYAEQSTSQNSPTSASSTRRNTQESREAETEIKPDIKAAQMDISSLAIIRRQDPLDMAKQSVNVDIFPASTKDNFVEHLAIRLDGDINLLNEDFALRWKNMVLEQSGEYKLKGENYLAPNLFDDAEGVINYRLWRHEVAQAARWELGMSSLEKAFGKKFYEILEDSVQGLRNQGKNTENAEKYILSKFMRDSSDTVRRDSHFDLMYHLLSDSKWRFDVEARVAWEELMKTAANKTKAWGYNWDNFWKNLLSVDPKNIKQASNTNW